MGADPEERGAGTESTKVLPEPAVPIPDSSTPGCLRSRSNHDPGGPAARTHRIGLPSDRSSGYTEIAQKEFRE